MKQELIEAIVASPYKKSVLKLEPAKLACAHRFLDSDTTAPPGSVKSAASGKLNMNLPCKNMFCMVEYWEEVILC